MSKIEKRLTKVLKNPQNAILVGNGFENLEAFLKIFKTVFYVNDTPPPFRAKNLIYRENSGDLTTLPDISAIIFDLDKVPQLNLYSSIWRRHKSSVIIEGNDAIGRNFSKPLYDSHWGCTSLQGLFHIWEEIK